MTNVTQRVSEIKRSGNLTFSEEVCLKMGLSLEDKTPADWIRHFGISIQMGKLVGEYFDDMEELKIAWSLRPNANEDSMSFEEAWDIFRDEFSAFLFRSELGGRS